MKKLLCLVLTFAMLLPTLLMGTVLDIAAADTTASVPNSYVTTGLVSLYSGTQNTRQGHDTASAVWEDLVSGHDVSVKLNDKNYFTEEGFHLNSQINNFPEAIKDLVNGDSFTVELLVSDMTSLGSSYNTLMNSYNDHFALFRRIDGNVLEFKYAANAQGSRPQIPNALDSLQELLITITYKVGGDCVIYYNGVEQSTTSAPNQMGADTMFFGHDQDTRNFDVTYRSMRFYNRDLTAAEVKHNAAVDGYADVRDLYVTEGLVSLYSGISNTENGYDPTATVWSDLIGDNDLSIATSQNSYFNPAGLYVSGVQYELPKDIVDLVNGNTFTVELSFDEFISIGGSFNTFLNSSNDNFALFRRNSNDVLEFKFAGNPGEERPKVANGLDLIDHGTVAVTYEVGGKCCLYVDGVCQAEVAAPKVMGADNLFIGHAEESKQFQTIYRSMRFYNRVLTAEEIAQNATADGTYAAVSTPGVIIPTYITVAQPKTNIVGDVAVTREVNSKAELTALVAGNTRPAAAIYHINDQLQVLDQNGKAFATLEEVLVATEYQVLPILVPANVAAVDAIAAFTKEAKFTDICILSADAALVNTARIKMPTVRGAVDFTEALKETTELTKEQCLEIRRTVRANAASVAVLPAHVADQDMVQYLYDVQVNVWVRTGDDLDETAAYRALLSGAVGVISDDTQTLLDLACALPKNTMTRVPLNVGHRGIPSKAPENTIEGSLYAYELGADCIELDVYLTTDGQIAVMHDGSTGRTCDQNLSVEGSTWAQLSELYVNKGFENNEKFKNCRIPRLQDYLEAFKDTDCRLFIEIKSSKTQIVKKIKELVDEYDMYGQCSVITFNTGIMDAMRRDYPEMSVGALCSGYLDETSSDADMKDVMSFIGKSNATLNPSYGGYGEKAIRAALIRGIGVFPWTFRGDAGTYQNHFMWGYSGLTGDNADVLKRFIKDVQVAVPTVEVGQTVTLEMVATYYDHREATVDAEIIVLEGGDAVTVDGNKLILNRETQAMVMMKYAYRLGNQSVTVYSQPFALGEQPEQLPPEDSGDTTPDEPAVTDPVDGTVTDTPDTNVESSTSSVGGVDTADITVSVDTAPAAEKGCASTVGGIGLVMLVASMALGACKVSKKKD